MAWRSRVGFAVRVRFDPERLRPCLRDKSLSAKQESTPRSGRPTTSAAGFGSVMDDAFAQDLAAVAGLDVVPRILEVVCRTTGMGFAAVARVTDERWIACAVRDE